MRMDQEPDIGPEPLPPPTREEQEAEAWEYWHQRAIKFETENVRLRAVIKDALEAYDSGNLQMNSPEIGEPENDIPMHPWHDEWLHNARGAIEIK